MKLLKDKIRKFGQIKDDSVLKVDSFLNHQIDTKVIDAIAEEFIKRFSDKKINKVLTVETSGIAIAYPVAQKLGVPLVFAKKKQSVNIDGKTYSSKIISYTHFREYNVIVSKRYLNEKDRVLIIDDILANGSDLRGLLSICQQSGTKVEGIGICIEKCFQNGSIELRSEGYEIQSLAKIESIDEKNNKIIFAK